VLEFDFFPLDNTVTFQYVFGSEEYPEYVNAGYNDVFGFFITGPNPLGGNYTNTNVALIPSTTIPVAIDNVHSGSHPAYYVDNQNIGGTTIVLDGFTTVLTATTNLVPCQQYHIKIAIADAGDGVFDSAVFLQANSFSSDAIDLMVSYTSGSTAAENCSQGILTATIGNPPASNYIVNYTVSGTATNADFTANIPTSITIPAGSTSASINLNPILDGLTEGTEYVVFALPNPCGTGFVYDTLWVGDNSTMSVNAGADQVICSGSQPVSLTATPNGGAPAYAYNWSNGAGPTQTVSVSPGVGTTNYLITVTDACGQTATDQVSITVNSIPTSTFTVTSPICPNAPSTITYTGTNAGSATPTWNFAGATVLSGSGMGPYQITWATSGDYNVTLSLAENGCTSTTTTQTITVLGPTDPACCGTWTLNSGADNSVCSLMYQLSATTNAPVGQWTSIPATATFSNATMATSTVTVPAPGGTFQFIYTVGPVGCQVRDTVVVTFTQQPVADAGQGGSVCSHQFQLNAAASVGTGTWTSNPTGPTFANSHGASTQVTVTADGQYTFTWTEDNGNGCSSQDQVIVNFHQQPSANAGPDDAECLLNYSLNAIPSVGTGTWTSNGPGTALFSAPNSATSDVTVNLTGQYYFVWTENNGGCISKDSALIQLTQTPTSTFTTTPINCFEETTTVTYTGTGSSLSTFNWSFGGGNPSPGFGYGPHIVGFTTPGTFDLSLSVSLNGCMSGITTQTVNMPTQLLSTISHDDIICYGASTGNISVTATGGTPFGGNNYMFLWSNGIMGANNFNVPGGAYTVTITDANGCTMTNGGTINEPQPFLAITSPDKTICLGETVFLTLYGIGGTPPYHYYWNGNPSNSVLGVTPTIETVYTGMIMDANNCSSNIDTTIIHIAPPVIVTLLQNTDSVCPGDPVNLTVSITGGIGPPYILFNQDGMVFSPPVHLNPEETMVYTVTAIDACGTRDTGSVTIHVLDAPPAMFLADTTEGCEPFTVNFLETNPDLGQTYLWDFGDNSNISLAKNPIHTFHESGTFDITLTVTSAEGCKRTETNFDFITVNPRPQSLFTWDPQFATIFKPFVQFTSRSSGAVQHYWFFGDNDSSSVIHPYHQYPAPGTYEVTLVTLSDFDCTDTAKANLVIKDDFTLYAPTAFSPDFNAINDVWYVSGHNIEAEGFHLSIYDRWGQIIWETDKYNPADPQQYGWDGKNKAGKVVKVDTYTWMVVCHDFKGNKQEFTGTVTVLR
jgi:gliding motility-associated-like protein